MKVRFIGIGKLVKDAAEVISESYDLTGYDIQPVQTCIKMVQRLEECIIDKDIVFFAVPTPDHPDYDGRYPTSHLKPKDFDYSIAINVTKEIDRILSKNT